MNTMNLFFAISSILSGTFVSLMGFRILKLKSQENNSPSNLKTQKISGLILLFVGLILLITL